MKYIIYKISIADYIYIGSTRDLKQRKIEHKYGFSKENNKEYNKKLYQTIRENGGWNCIDISPVEEYECETTQQAHIREEFWRREYNAQLNSRKAHRTREEYAQGHRNQAKAYYATNKETILEQTKEKIQCECGATIRIVGKSRHDKSKKHIDRIAEQQNNLAVV